MKKSLQILVVMLFALLLLAACGQSADQEKDKSADKPKTEQKKNATEDEQKKDEPKKEKDESDDSKVDEKDDNKSKDESSSDANDSKSNDTNEKDNEKETEQPKQDQVEDKDQANNPDKDKQDSSDTNYKQDAIFHFTMNDGVDVYVYSANAKEETLKADSGCGSAGQKVYKGDYSLVSVNSQTNATHKLPIGEASFTKGSNEANVIKGDPELLLLSMCQGSDLYTSQTFVMTSKGELKAVKDTDGNALNLDVKPDLIKSTGKNKYQMAVFTNVDPDTNWYFYDLTLDPKTYQMSIGEKIIPSDLRNFDMREWKKDPNYKL